MNAKIIIPIGAALLLSSGCANIQRKHARLQKVAQTNNAAIVEESRVLTTAVVDVLTQSNAPLALKLARQDQQLEGLPVRRMEVLPLLAGDTKALAALEQRFTTQEKLLADQQVIETKRAAEQTKLVTLGKEQEAAKAKSFLRRLIAGFGITGLIALCIFVPPAIPILTQLASWAVSKIPALSGFLGVVSRKTFDAVVSGVGRVRASYKSADRKAALAHMDSALTEATTPEQRRFIEHRREELGV